MQTQGKLFIISAPSGAGKTSLTKYVLQKIGQQYNLSRIITYTSRPPRTNEKNGTDYHFISRESFIKKQQLGFFLETNEYDHNFYGSPKSLLKDLAAGKSFIVVLDRNGSKSLINLVKNPVLIWLTLPSSAVLNQRLAHRTESTPQELKTRFSLAQEEMATEKRDPLFTYHVCNDQFEQAAEKIISIIQKELKN
jgi:guanylate kinase